jgi:rhodanese-related sulfurtransferase/glyoxylase-like metal-dependent hydrolase (beta-lactamase superfamily II)
VIFEQFYLECLSHASYLVGDETTGRALVVDPQRDVGGYLAEAEQRGLAIESVIETHVHADFLSGHLELAAHSGARIAYGDAVTGIEFPVERLRHGESLSLGDVTIEVRATPGHTPESISLVVYEHAGDAVPYGVLTGDCLFIGDVGRPDLLAAAGTGLSADDLGRRLFRSLHEQLLTLPDATRVFPAHGAGSACGKKLSSETSSTIGEQRRTNYALAPMTEDEFVAAVTEGQPAAPHYFSFDVSRNRELRPLLEEDLPPPLLTLGTVLGLERDGAALLDTREPMDFAAGHLRGAINVGLQGRFAEFAGDVLDPRRPVVLVGDPVTALEAKLRLARIGFDRVVGQLDDPHTVFVEQPELAERGSRLTIEQLAERRADIALQLVDVRGPGETADGVIEGTTEVPLPVLTDTLDGLDRTRPTVVYCGSGYRSSIATSVLRSAGFTDVSDLLGGYAAWEAAGLPVIEEARNAMSETMPVPEVGPDDARALVDSGALLLDVREPDEWEAGHAPDARFLPMGRVQAQQDELPKDRRIVAVCRLGGRSAAVTEALNSWGFDAVNLAGGMRAWAAAGLPVVTDAGADGAVI